MPEEEINPQIIKVAPAPIALHVILNGDGIPGWIGPEAREGSQEIIWPEDFPDGVTDPVLFLAAHRLLPEGVWVSRPPPPPVTEEEVAAQEAEIALSIRLQEERDARAREEEIVRRSGPDQLLRSIGKITIAELTARVATIRADVEAGR